MLKKQNLLDAITPQDALEILRILSRENPQIAGRIEQTALRYLSKVDAEKIAGEVYSALNQLDVRELWNRSGPNYDGYTEPGQMAYDMFAQAIDPFLMEMKKYQKLSRSEEAKLCCMAILHGIDRYGKESKAEFKDWAGDRIAEHLYWVFEEWKKGSRGPEDRKEMKEYVSSIMG